MITRWKVTKEDRTSPQAQGVYCRDYTKGKTVKAHKGTFGIMTFKTEKQARNWAGRACVRAQILQVKPIGKGKIPVVLANREYFSLFYRYKRILNSKKIAALLRFKEEDGKIDYKVNGRDIILWAVPKGTICYPAVEVLT